MTDEKNPENGQESSSLTMEQVNTIVNSAISSRLKSFEKKFEDFAQRLAPQSQEEPKKDEKLSNQELNNLKKQFDALQKERDGEVTKRKDFELRNAVKEQLLAAGVAPHLQKAAMAMLVDSDKVVGYDEDNQIVFKTATGDVDLASGLKNWSRTDEGKAFVAARGTQGSGERSFAKPNNNLSEKLSRTDVGNMLEEALVNGGFNK